MFDLLNVGIQLPPLDEARRVTISGELTREELDPADANKKQLKVTSMFRVQNVSKHPNSLKPEVRFTGWVYVLGERSAINFDLTISDLKALSLPPFEPKDIEAINEAAPAGYLHSWFQTYTLTPTVGRKQKVRVWNASKLPVGPFKFYVFLFLFRFCRWPWKYSRIVA
jgi:hypothetical protein